MLIQALIFYFITNVVVKMFEYRARGGAIPLGSTTLARLVFWGLPYAIDGAIFAWLLGMPGYAIASMAAVCLLLGWCAAIVEHSKWQSPGVYNGFVMGLITTGMLTIMLAPFFYFDHEFIAFLPLGMLGWLSSYFGYSVGVQKHGLYAFGVQWCKPGDSSWEEFFIGGFPFGVTICAIGLYLVSNL